MKHFALIAVLILVACSPTEELRDTEMAIGIKEAPGIERTEYFFTTWEECQDMVDLSTGRIGLDGKEWITFVSCDRL